MIQPLVRSRRLVLVFSLTVLGTAALAHAQTTATPKGTTTNNGVTGTDPCPKNYICTTGASSPTSAVSKTAPAATTSGTVMQAILSLLGAN